MKDKQNSSQSEQSEPASSDSPSPVIKTASDRVSRKSQRKISRSSKSDVITTRRKTNPLVWLVLLVNTLLLLSLSSAAAYAWLQWQSWSAAQSESEVGLKQDIQASVAAQLSDVNNSTVAKLSLFENRLTTDIKASIAASDTKIAELEQKMTGLQGSVTTDWDMVELRYLLKMAQRKVSIEGDAQAAIAILSEADAMLFVKNENSYLPLREAISSDIQTLKAAKLNNPAESAIALSGLLELAQKLVFPEPDVFYEEHTYEMTNDPQDWWQNMKTVWRKMVDDFLTVEKLEEDLKPYLAGQEKQTVRAALQQSLLTARYAVLKQEQTLFVMAINESLALLQQFDAQQAEVTVFAAELKRITEAPFPKKVNIRLTATTVYSSLFDVTAPAPAASNTLEEQSL